jgi:hypothetical protein
MSLVSKGTPIAVATDIDYHEDIDSIVRTETIVQHIEETASDLTIAGSLKAEISDVDQLYANAAQIGTIDCQEIDSREIVADILVTGSLGVTGHSQLDTVTANGLIQGLDLKGGTLNLTAGTMELAGTDYIVSNKYLAADTNDPESDEVLRRPDRRPTNLASPIKRYVSVPEAC